MQHRFYGLRGKAYVNAYKLFLEQHGEKIRQQFLDIVQEKGKFTLKDLGQMCVSFRVPVKLMDDCLPSLTNGKYPTGTWELQQARGVKAKDIGVIWE